jgi:hypothetical protein
MSDDISFDEFNDDIVKVLKVFHGRRDHYTTMATLCAAIATIVIDSELGLEEIDRQLSVIRSSYIMARKHDEMVSREENKKH